MVILSTRNCYIGHNVVDDSWVIDSIDSLESDKAIDDSTIEYSAEQWLSETKYFSHFMQDYINEFEIRFNTEVIGFALAGSVGLWNGAKEGGDVYDLSHLSSKILSMGKVDEIDVVIEDDRTITIRGSHHDGVHYMNIYLITNRRLMKAGYGKRSSLEHILSYDKLGLLRYLTDNYAPVKLPLHNEYYEIKSKKSKSKCVA